MITLSPPAESILEARVFRWAVLWVIERQDLTTLRYTSHNRPIEFSADGDNQTNTYDPVGSLNHTAREGSVGPRDANLDVSSYISSDAITEDDLRAGLYRHAKITMYLVDWMWPFLGAIATEIYWVGDTRWAESWWEAQLSSIGSKLRNVVGRTYDRICNYALGDDQCGVSLAAYASSGSVTSIDTQRRQVQTSLTTKADNYFNHGRFLWTSGNNDDTESIVKDYTQTNGVFQFQLATGKDIQVGDNFTAYAGCDRLQTTCDTKFSNLARHGGFGFMPGTSVMMRPVGAERPQ